MAYSLGVLTVALVGAVVTGVRLSKRVNTLETCSEDNSEFTREVERNLHKEVDELQKRIDELDSRVFDRIDKDIDDVYKTIDSRYDKLWNKLKKVEQEENLSVNN